MSEFNNKDYRREKFNKKKKDIKKTSQYPEEHGDITKRNKEFKRKKQHLRDDNWEENIDELY
jgi:uncharacterized protein YozE (UPF0346 family)